MSEDVAQILQEAEAGEVFIITSSFTLLKVVKIKGEAHFHRPTKRDNGAL